MDICQFGYGSHRNTTDVVVLLFIIFEVVVLIVKVMSLEQHFLIYVKCRV